MYKVTFTVLAAVGIGCIHACTGIKLVSQKGSAVHGRTMEFDIDLETSIAVIPKGYAFTSTTPLGQGRVYKAKYAALGIMAFNQPAIFDGINEKGLSVGTFYFPGFAEYAEIGPENQNLAVSPIEFPNWVLTQFATLDEVKNALSHVVIAPTICMQWGNKPPPFHYIVFDRQGKSLVIEPIKGHLNVYDNKIGVLTNSPSFNWHMSHLRHFIPWNLKPMTLNGVDLTTLEHALTLPGDFTPASRFVRAALFSMNAKRPENTEAAVYEAFHILNQFDIPKGIIKEETAKKMIYTHMICVRDPESLKYYFKTYEDSSIRMVDLSQFDLENPYIKRICTQETNQPMAAADISSELE